MTDKKERIALSTTSPSANNLNVITLQRHYEGKGTFKVTGARLSTFGGKDPKPVVDLVHSDGNEYYFTVNKTNQYTLGQAGYAFLDELQDKELVLEVYDTGGVGNFAFGIKVLEVL